MKLLETIKTIKADIRTRQLHPAGSQRQDSDTSQDLAIVQKVQQMQREIQEARSKKELVKGILRVSFALSQQGTQRNLNQRRQCGTDTFLLWGDETGVDSGVRARLDQEAVDEDADAVARR